MSDPQSLVLLGLGAALALTIAYLAFHTILLCSGADPNAEVIARRLTTGHLEQELVTRWLQRSRWSRNVGGITGFLAGLLLLISENPIGMAVTGGIAGIAVGSLLAESHLLSTDERSADQRRVVDLRPRRPSDYWQPKRQLLLILVGLAAASVATAEIIGDDTIEVSSRWSTAAAATVAAAMIFQWRIANRRRPALPESLRSADDLIRHLAITRGVADPALMCSLVFLAKATHPGHATVSALLWLAALRVFWTNRRLGLDWLMDQPADGDAQVVTEAHS